MVGTATLVVGHNLLFRVHIEQFLFLGVWVRRYQASYLLLFEKDRTQVLVAFQNIVIILVFMIARTSVLWLLIIAFLVLKDVCYVLLQPWLQFVVGDDRRSYLADVLIFAQRGSRPEILPLQFFSFAASLPLQVF